MKCRSYNCWISPCSVCLCVLSKQQPWWSDSEGCDEVFAREQPRPQPVVGIQGRSLPAGRIVNNMRKFHGYTGAGNGKQFSAILRITEFTCTKYDPNYARWCHSKTSHFTNWYSFQYYQNRKCAHNVLVSNITIIGMLDTSQIVTPFNPLSSHNVVQNFNHATFTVGCYYDILQHLLLVCMSTKTSLKFQTIHHPTSTIRNILRLLNYKECISYL